VHDVAQKTYDDIAALVASRHACGRRRKRRDAAILARVRSWKGEDDAKPKTEGSVNHTTGGWEPPTLPPSDETQEEQS
jgi:hypothetical protein